MESPTSKSYTPGCIIRVICLEGNSYLTNCYPPTINILYSSVSFLSLNCTYILATLPYEHAKQLKCEVAHAHTIVLTLPL